MKSKHDNDTIQINRHTLNRIAHGALKATFNAHGEIAPKLFGSVLKRFNTQLELYVISPLGAPKKPL